ncbi:MAG: GNAT family N-acetyltransferase [Bdellovibrio sp.]|nr:GNAT family N-acetyltransferase [Bdellovibrio sp.]
MINYKFDIAEEDFSKICNLYKSAGWWEGPCSSKQVSDLISGSLCFMTAWWHDKLVGMGRAISDGSDDAYLQDIFVEEEFRRQGIAAKIVGQLRDYCLSKNIHWIALIAAPGSVPLYEKLGFKEMTDYTPMQFHEKSIESDAE